jgi:hypothetical protein
MHIQCGNYTPASLRYKQVRVVARELAEIKVIVIVDTKNLIRSSGCVMNTFFGLAHAWNNL